MGLVRAPDRLPSTAARSALAARLDEISQEAVISRQEPLRSQLEPHDRRETYDCK